MYVSVLNKFYSAKREEDVIIPQSSQVLIHHSGWCKWSPTVIWAASHCPMDSTWFPFDEQRCKLDYEPWKYKSHEVNITSYFDDENKSIEVYDLQPNDLWEFLGKHLISKNATISFKFTFMN